MYLDTADLLNIGDGRVAAGDLVRAMARTDAVLVVSREHVQDASHGDLSAVDSLIRGVESFPRVAVVMDGPHAVEPLTTDRREAEVQQQVKDAEMNVAACMRDAAENARMR